MPAAQPVAAPTPTMTSDGRVAGIDGMLDQVAAALVKQVSADTAMQDRVGAAAGKAAAGVVIEAAVEALFVAGLLRWLWNSLPER